MNQPLLSLGLMSGTSLDGVDAALIRTDGEKIFEFGPLAITPYPDDLRDRLRQVLGAAGDVRAVGREITLFHAEVVSRLIEEAGLSAEKIDLVGFHGHTVLHDPAGHRTLQIGDGRLLAECIKIAVVNDFRSADMAEGGQGAPLAPAFHRAMAERLEKPLAVLNLGGVGNLTWIGSDETMLAFDTGPGNALLDDWIFERTGRRFDEGGALSLSGRVDQAALAAFAAHPYFRADAPKSLDRDDFKELAARLTEGMGLADGAATLAAFTVRAVRLGLDRLPAAPKRWLVTGGGRHNKTLMAGLAGELMAPVEPVESVGWNGDALEAQAFAFLAVRSLKGMPLTWPGTTGVGRPLSGGRLHEP